MAKGKKSSSRGEFGGRRDHSFSPSPSRSLTFRLPVLLPSPSLPPFPVFTDDLLPVEDRRSFHFDKPYQPPLMDDARPARVVLQDRPKNRNRVKPGAYRFGAKVRSQTKAIQTFAEPERVVVCIRRQRRKEVLFAKRKAGRGGMRPPRRTWLSNISCRR